MRSAADLWNDIVLWLMRGVFSVIARRFPLLRGAAHPLNSIVIFSTAGIGDTLSDTPAIRAVQETYPACRITAVVHHRRREVLADNPYIDALVPHKKGVLGFFRTLRAIRQARPDVAIVLRANDPDIWPLAYLSGAQSLVGRPANTQFSFLINRPVPVPEWDRMHGAEQTLAIVEELGAGTADPRLVFQVNAAARRQIQELLTAWNLDGASLVAMQVHASPRLAFRDWPAESFVQVGRAILRDYPVRLILTGGREDRAKAVAVQQALGSGARCVAGTLRLSETAALLERCRALLTTDTGIMHLGFAVRVPTLALLHPYNAHRVGPHGYGRLHRVVLLPRSLWQGEDPPRVGMDRLSPEEVFQVFRKFYGELERIHSAEVVKETV